MNIYDRERLKKMEASEKRLRSMLMSGKENYPHQNEMLEGKQRENGNSSRGILVEESQNMLLIMGKLKEHSNADNLKVPAGSKKIFESETKVGHVSSSQQSHQKVQRNKIKHVEQLQNRDEISFKKKNHSAMSQDRRNSVHMVNHKFVAVPIHLFPNK